MDNYPPGITEHDIDRQFGSSENVSIENLTQEQEDILRGVHAENYMGTDDDMPEAYESWVENLTEEEINSILSSK